MTFYPDIKFRRALIFSTKAPESVTECDTPWFVHLLPAPTFRSKVLLGFTTRNKKTELGDFVISEVTSTLIPHPVLTRRACLRGDLFPRAA